MEKLTEYRDEIERVFAEAANEASRFPAPFDRIGHTLLDRCNPRSAGGRTNLVCFLLPFWLKERTESSDTLCLNLAVGNVFAMLHFFLLDDVIDGDAGEGGIGAREALLLSELCRERFRAYYNRHFGADSALWAYERRYLEEWTRAVADERKVPADPRDPERLARKSAPLKLSSTGMLLLAGRQADIPRLSEAIELVLATLQLSDDWADWREDLAQEQANAFLELVREGAELPPDEPLTERRVRQAIYRESALDRLAGIARTYGERLDAMADVPPPLLDFHEEMYRELVRDAAAAQETVRRLAAEGGFSYFLSKR
ncbi:hypothetical protein [Cohnella sp. REN36]|uniref:hypothetical protein n=1 Tax=Cohnella sp. REN36 TaxID=2887347 RepID=UPI001D146899|nr:hypothetical protein [Cohnella sp. REN36]MCC3372698.1 hypothetical protein [Cohnella sp. REN36]